MGPRYPFFVRKRRFATLEGCQPPCVPRFGVIAQTLPACWLVRLPNAIVFTHVRLPRHRSDWRVVGRWWIAEI